MSEIKNNSNKAKNVASAKNVNASSSLDAFTKEGFKTITEAIRTSNALPSDRDWNFYKLNETFSKIVRDEGDRVLRQINKILRKYEVEDNIRARGSEEKTELLVEANDMILERVGDNIDEMNGIKKKMIAPVEYQAVSAQLPISGSWNRLNKATFSISTSLNSLAQTNETIAPQAIRLLTGKNILRPQKFFKDKIDNRNTPWEPRITDKPNSIRPLALFLEETEFGEAFCHPYEMELDQFNPPPEQLTQITPAKPLCVTKTPLHEISTPEKLDELLEELRKHKEIAVDLEHHSYRTFMGITCLMQISTRDADYLIDTLELRDKLHILNEVFTKPSIVKILHGAESDVQWLQRDLSLYIVNMFDTYQAAKQLGYSSLSLAYLLNRFCKFLPNKQFQLADWRIRPLPEELKNYAREDTHYLIYIYHMLRNELLKQGNGSDHILKSVIQKSTEVCKKRYIKPILRDESHLDFYRKCKRLFDNRQMHALKELYEWRDKTAREEDESTGYILPNHMLLQISEMLPREVQGILACCNPIPPLVRSNLLELHQIILRARDQSLEKPIMKEDNRDRGSTQQFSKLNIENPLYCPHDLTKQQEFRDDLPTLLGSKEAEEEESFCSVLDVKSEIEKTTATISLFESADEDTNYKTAEKISELKFLGPFERYKLVKPYIQAEELKEAAAAETAVDNKPNEKDDRTNEDRIASLHQHFLKLSKETPQKLPEETKYTQETYIVPEEYQPTLVDGTEVTRKRKRSEHEGGPPSHFNTYKRKRNYFNDDGHAKKRKRVDGGQIDQQQTLRNFGKAKKFKRQNYNKKAAGNEFNVNEFNVNSDQQNCDGVQKNGSRYFSPKQKKNKNFKKFNNMNNANFSAFDYSSVDYGQFHGGAGSAAGTMSKVDSKFKQKNKNKMQGGKAHNKFFTFKHRRGRGNFNSSM